MDFHAVPAKSFRELERGDPTAYNHSSFTAACLFQNTLCIIHMVKLKYAFQICTGYFQRQSLRTDSDQQFIVGQYRFVIKLKRMCFALDIDYTPFQVTE